MKPTYRVLIYTLIGMPIFFIGKYISNDYYSGILTGVIMSAVWTMCDIYLIKDKLK